MLAGAIPARASWIHSVGDTAWIQEHDTQMQTGQPGTGLTML
jgi:hypothetical protein